jgi:hypothetical protein
MTTTPPLTARAVTRALRAAGFELFTSSLEAPGIVRCTQRYATRGALAPSDLRSRREQRAAAAAAALNAAGYRADHVGDRVRVAAR